MGKYPVLWEESQYLLLLLKLWTILYYRKSFVERRKMLRYRLLPHPYHTQYRETMISTSLRFSKKIYFLGWNFWLEVKRQIRPYVSNGAIIRALTWDVRDWMFDSLSGIRLSKNLRLVLYKTWWGCSQWLSVWMDGYIRVFSSFSIFFF